MDELAYKVRLAAFWLLSAVAFFAYRTLALSADATEVSVLGSDDFGTYLLVMMIFTFLTLTLPAGLNRLVNLVAGGIFGVIQAIMLIDGVVRYPSEIFNLMTAVTVVSMASVVLLAYRWQTVAREPDIVTHQVRRRDRTHAGV